MKNTHDIIMESIEHFAGMSGKEIDAYLKKIEEREKRLWEKEWDKRQAQERAEDKAYMVSDEFKQHQIPSALSIEIDSVTAMLPLPVVNGFIYVSEDDLKRGFQKLKLTLGDGKEGRVLYIPANFKSRVQFVDRLFRP